MGQGWRARGLELANSPFDERDGPDSRDGFDGGSAHSAVRNINEPTCTLNGYEQSRGRPILVERLDVASLKG
jgi:hypothetical protein